MGGRAAQQVLWAGVCLAPLQVILILRVLSRWDFFCASPLPGGHQEKVVSIWKEPGPSPMLHCGRGSWNGCAILKAERRGFLREEETQAGGFARTDTGPCSHHPKGTGWNQPALPQGLSGNPAPSLTPTPFCIRSLVPSLWGKGRKGRPHARAASPITRIH